jgi:hypothetical protein
MKKIMMEIIFNNFRTIPPVLNNGKYRPHLVVDGNKEYFGIKFLDGDDVISGKKIRAIAECFYEGVNYDMLKENVSFNIMEGANKVGDGKILDLFE